MLCQKKVVNVKTQKKLWMWKPLGLAESNKTKQKRSMRYRDCSQQSKQQTELHIILELQWRLLWLCQKKLWMWKPLGLAERNKSLNWLIALHWQLWLVGLFLGNINPWWDNSWSCRYSHCAVINVFHLPLTWTNNSLGRSLILLLGMTIPWAATC